MEKTIINGVDINNITDIRDYAKVMDETNFRKLNMNNDLENLIKEIEQNSETIINLFVKCKNSTPFIFRKFSNEFIKDIVKEIRGRIEKVEYFKDDTQTTNSSH